VAHQPAGTVTTGASIGVPLPASGRIKLGDSG
jgi:hypothetical protein